MDGYALTVKRASGVWQHPLLKGDDTGGKTASFRIGFVAASGFGILEDGGGAREQFVTIAELVEAYSTKEVPGSGGLKLVRPM